MQYVVIDDGIIRKCWNYWCFTASRVYISAYSVITFSGADNHFNLPFTISAALVKVEGNTGLESKCYVQPFHPIRYCSLIIFSKKHKCFMDSNSFWRFRQKSDWFTDSELYNQITYLLKQHCIHDVNVDVINIRKCQLKPVT